MTTRRKAPRPAVRALAVIAGVMALSVPSALAQDAALGRTLVDTYCSVCHSIERTGTSPHPDAPPFRTLGALYDVEMLSEALVEGLVSGHPDMPEFAFDPYEAAAIVSYLKWLGE